MQNIVAPMLGSGIRKEPLFYLYSNRDITSGIYINSYNHTIMDLSNSYIRPGEERYLYIYLIEILCFAVLNTVIIIMDM